MSENDDIEVDSDADKRAHHNALERKRRDHIKDSFHGLRDSVPSLQGEKWVTGELVPISSSLWVRGGVHPGQVAISSNGTAWYMSTSQPVRSAPSSGIATSAA
ncbi:hypothetical protein ATANTOWER_031591 [Ataeniobius toweri]|uniref:Protein max n=1 Tax=Ataeniobius toweri TaxID=208326 RepID=A0ABU7BEC0_9TELE|nr:hypothetical protein [Ataeniobius toweri]